MSIQVFQVFNFLLALVYLLEYNPLSALEQQTKLLPIYPIVHC